MPTFFGITLGQAVDRWTQVSGLTASWDGHLGLVLLQGTKLLISEIAGSFRLPARIKTEAQTGLKPIPIETDLPVRIGDDRPTLDIEIPAGPSGLLRVRSLVPVDTSDPVYRTLSLTRAAAPSAPSFVPTYEERRNSAFHLAKDNTGSNEVAPIDGLVSGGNSFRGNPRSPVQISFGRQVNILRFAFNKAESVLNQESSVTFNRDNLDPFPTLTEESRDSRPFKDLASAIHAPRAKRQSQTQKSCGTDTEDIDTVSLKAVPPMLEISQDSKVEGADTRRQLLERFREEIMSETGAVLTPLSQSSASSAMIEMTSAAGDLTLSAGKRPAATDSGSRRLRVRRGSNGSSLPGSQQRTRT